MKKYNFLLFILILMGFQSNTERSEVQKTAFVMAIHGGAGNIIEGNYTAGEEEAYHKMLNIALETGAAILEGGGTSVDAVEAAIMVMENSPLFNAGKGAVFSSAGKNELDASIMDGSNLQAGAVAGVMQIKNPIKAARLVMEKSRHVMLSGEGAEDFAKEHGLEIVDNKYFYTEKRWKSYQRAKKKGEIKLDHDTEKEEPVKEYKEPKKQEEGESTEGKYGTVGVVALDQHGNLAAGTSTGGLTNKKWGRIGDSPIIGAGTYADNRTCAVSATGTGEYFIRGALAYDISARMRYGGRALEQAAAETIRGKLSAMGGDGGVIAIDAEGHVVFNFNTAGMFRGYIKSSGEQKTMMYGE